MIYAILIGRKGSKGFLEKILKRLTVNECEYPLLAAKQTKSIEKIFISTDCPVIKIIKKNIMQLF